VGVAEVRVEVAEVRAEAAVAEVRVEVAAGVDPGGTERTAGRRAI
jgi:hypothetical protein